MNRMNVSKEDNTFRQDIYVLVKILGRALIEESSTKKLFCSQSSAIEKYETDF